MHPPKYLAKIFLLAFLLFFSGQNECFADRWIYNGDTLFENTNLLESHPEFEEIKQKLFGDVDRNFPPDCPKGYRVEWRIIEDRVYLNTIFDCQGEPVSLKGLFGKDCQKGRVKASWMTEKIYFPAGEIIWYMDEFSRFFDQELVFVVEAGLLTQVDTLDYPDAHLSKYHNNFKLLQHDILRKVDWDKIPEMGQDRKTVYLTGFYCDSSQSAKVTLVRGLDEEGFNQEALNAVKLLEDWDVLYLRGQAYQLSVAIPIHFSEEYRRLYTKARQEKPELTAKEILQKTIQTIDTIHTIQYKQAMERSNPRDINDTLIRYREMYFKRLPEDSIVGVKGHWYMLGQDRQGADYHDIYNGKRLARLNYAKKNARVYDLERYPDFRKQHFWSHNTLYGMQHEFRYMLDHPEHYQIKRLKDTVVGMEACYQVEVRLENFTTMPGFWINLEDAPGAVSVASYSIDKKTLYPIDVHIEFYSSDQPHQKSFLHQFYYELDFNGKLNADEQFTNSEAFLSGYEIIEMKPIKN